MLTIALVFSYSLYYCRCVLRGVRAHAKSRPNWILLPVTHDVQSVRALRNCKVDGVIAHIYDKNVARELFRLKKPLVNVCGIMPWLKAPRVGQDDYRIGRLAASHLAERGFESFAFIGHKTQGASVERLSGFRDALADFHVDVFHWPKEGFHPQGWSIADNSGLLRFLSELPKPVGIFVPGDVWGLQISEFCRQLKIKMPEEAALIGVDNDDLYCELTQPSLSSIAIPGERTGLEAAALLERLLRGARPPAQPLLLPPLGVVTRESTDLLAIRDEDIVGALTLIRNRLADDIGVADVAAHIAVSRRSLERKFRTVLGRGVAQEIRRLRVEHAKDLLVHTHLPIAEIARQSGFLASKRLAIIFRKVTGQTPTSFRAQRGR